MSNKLILIFVLLLNITCVFAQAETKCMDSLSEIVKGDSVKEEKLQEFLKLQAGLTMHKLALATFSSGINKERFTLEGKILTILDEMDDNRKDAEFDRVYKMFKHPKNKLSRHALAEVLPLISDILDKQNQESDPVKRQLFNLNISDIKMLSILTEKEKKYNSGAYAHILSSNTASDNSVLNFTKIINSSMRNTNRSVDDIRKTMTRRLNKLNTMTNKLIVDLLSGTECEVLIQACSKVADDGSVIVDKGLLNSFASIAQNLSNPDKFKYLRYGDVWLYTKNRPATKKSVPKTYEYFQTQQKSDDEIIQDYLVQHVLDNIPYFFTKREELENDPELTLALARAIDRGALNYTDPKKRVFNYKGKEYSIPMTWNIGYSGNRLVKMGKETKDKILNFFKAENTKIIYPSDINESEKESFLDKRNEQLYNHGQKLTFEYKGYLYNMDGSKVEKSIDGLLTYPTGSNAPFEKYELSDEDKKMIAMEISDKNSSYIKENKVFYISGVEASFGLVYKRAKMRYERSDVTVKGAEEFPYPDIEATRKLISNNTEVAPIILKGMVDQHRAIVHDDQLIDIVTSKVISKDQAVNIILNYRMGQDHIARTPSSINGFDEQYLKSNAAAILNKKHNFKVKEKAFYAASGSPVDQEGKDSTLLKGMISHEQKHEEIIWLNSLPQKDMIVEYHRKFQENKCKHYSIVDKKNGKLSVFFQDGRIAYEEDVLVGSEQGDERTRYYGDFTNRETNKKTGAGVYHLGLKVDKNKSDHFSQFEGNYLTLTTADDKHVVTGMHQISTATPQRNTFLNNNDPKDNRSTAGGVSLGKESMKTYIDNYYAEGCPLYILPDQDKVSFKVVGDQLVFEGNEKIAESDYFLQKKKKEAPKNISISMNDSRYMSDFTSEYVLTLQERKADIMKHLNLTNDEYNELTKLAFGVLGTETDFAESKLYKFKETRVGQQLITDIKDYGMLGGATKSALTPPLWKWLTYKENSKNSMGASQIKDAKSYIPKEFNIENTDLNKPDNAAVATMFVLAQKYNAFKKCESKHAGITESNRMEYVYYFYMGSAHQVCSGSATSKLNQKADEVRGYASSLTISEEP